MNSADQARPFIELAYDMLADAIDAAGPRRESLFLAKLALTLANEIGDAEKLDRLIQTALRDAG